MRYLAVSLLFLAGSLASAQDMPLHEIIKPGETWKQYAGEMPKAKPSKYSVDSKAHSVLIDGKPAKIPLGEPTACVVALGGSQLLVADATERYVWAFRIEKDGSLGPGDRYGRLRVAGDERRRRFTPPEKYRADPSALTTDASNRTYVATNLGIQVLRSDGAPLRRDNEPPGPGDGASVLRTSAVCSCQRQGLRPHDAG